MGEIPVKKKEWNCIRHDKRKKEDVQELGRIYQREPGEYPWDWVLRMTDQECKMG